MFAWFFVSALYMQLVLGYGPMQIGLAFLPANLIMAAFSLGLSATLVMRLGIRLPLAMGLALAAIGYAQGFIVGAASLTGLLIGGAAGAWRICCSRACSRPCWPSPSIWLTSN
mgnify:CR=1 FL=1